MGFTPRPTGNDDLDRVQRDIAAALSELRLQVVQLVQNIAVSGGGALVPTGVVPGTYQTATIQVNVFGQIVAATAFAAVAGEVVYGGAAGALAQSGNLTYDDTAATRGLRVNIDASGTSPGRYDPFQANMAALSAGVSSVGWAAYVLGTQSFRDVATTDNAQLAMNRSVFFRNDLFPGVTTSVFTLSSNTTVGGLNGGFTYDFLNADCGIGTNDSIPVASVHGFGWLGGFGAGTPSGVPSSQLSAGSRVAIVPQASTKRLYAYVGGAWHYSVFDDGAGGSGISALTGDVTATGPGSAVATIVKVAALNTNGFVKTTGGTGTLAVDTTTYQVALTSASGANLTSKFILQGTADAGAPNAQFLGALATGFVKNTTTTGVLTVDTNTYLTTAAAAATYWPIPALTNKDVLYATGASTVGQSSTFQFDSGTNTLSVNVVDGTVFKNSAGGATFRGSGGTVLTDLTGTLVVSTVVGDLTVQANTGSAGPALKLTAAGATLLTGLTSNGFVKTSGGTGTLSIDTSTYLTTASAAATYLTIATAASTYMLLQSLTNGRVVYATGASTLATNAGFLFDATTQQLTLGTPGSNPSPGSATLYVKSGFNTGSGLTRTLWVQDNLANGQANISAGNWFLTGSDGIMAYDSDMKIVGTTSGGGSTGIIFKFGVSPTTGAGGTTVLAMDAVTGNWIFGASDVTVNGSKFASSTLGGVKVDALGNVRLGQDATLATNATDGFPQMPQATGRFTGTPTMPFTSSTPFGLNKSQNNLQIWSTSGAQWLAWPAFNVAATPSVGVPVFTNAPAGIVSLTAKWWQFTDAGGTTTYIPYLQ